MSDSSSSCECGPGSERRIGEILSRSWAAIRSRGDPTIVEVVWAWVALQTGSVQGTAAVMHLCQTTKKPLIV